LVLYAAFKLRRVLFWKIWNSDSSLSLLNCSEKGTTPIDVPLFITLSLKIKIKEYKNYIFLLYFKYFILFNFKSLNLKDQIKKLV
jgi:hypothetical protein